MPISCVLNVIGLSLNLVGAVRLANSIFITDEEINALSELPIDVSSTNLSPVGSNKIYPVAITDAEKLKLFRDRFIDARKKERKKGRQGLYLIIAGFLMQLLGQIF